MSNLSASQTEESFSPIGVFSTRNAKLSIEVRKKYQIVSTFKNHITFFFLEIRFAEKKKASSSSSSLSFPISTNGETLLRLLKLIYCPPIIPIKELSQKGKSSSSTSSSASSVFRSLVDSSEDLSPELTTLLRKYRLLIEEEEGETKTPKKETETFPMKESPEKVKGMKIFLSEEKSFHFLFQTSRSASLSRNSKVIPDLELDTPLCETSALLMRNRLSDISILPKVFQEKKLQFSNQCKYRNSLFW